MIIMILMICHLYYSIGPNHSKGCKVTHPVVLGVLGVEFGILWVECKFVRRNAMLLKLGPDLKIKYLNDLHKGSRQKKLGKAVRLTAWVDPPPSPKAVRKM